MKSQTLRRVRLYHLYLGVFFAPAIIFFAISGGLQTFRLQEAGGWGGPPPQWIVWMAAAHKDQAPPRPKRPRPPEAPGAGAPVARADTPRPGTAPSHRSKLPLQIFVAGLAIALALSALLGILIAVTARATRRIAIVMLLAGAVLPLLLFTA